MVTIKFYGNGVVWNPSTNNVLCKFKDGEFETDNLNVIKALTEAGYKHDKEAMIELDITPKDSTERVKIEVPKPPAHKPRSRAVKK